MRNENSKPIQFYANDVVFEKLQTVPKQKRSQFINECIEFATARGERSKLHSPQLRIAHLERKTNDLEAELAMLRNEVRQIARPDVDG